MSLQSIQKNLYQYGGPILMILGTISCLLNLMMFTHKKIRKSPSSIYFIALEISNFLYIFTSFSAVMLENGYHINPSSFNLVCCRLRIYVGFLFDILPSFYLIMASIDRILCTSSNVSIRRRSTYRFAYLSIISGTLFWIIFHSHALLFSTILQIGSNTLICYFPAGLYTVFAGYYTLIKSILIPLLLTIFGLWTMKNIQRVGPSPIISITENQTRRALPYSSQLHNRVLGRILFIDVIVFILFRLMIGIFLMYQQITQNSTKSVERINIELFIRLICLFSAYIPPCIGCYLNLFISKPFRKQMKNIILCK